MRAKLLPLMVAAILAGTSGSTAIADDGEIVNKNMSRTINDLVEDVPGAPEAEHAFAEYMKFYVPAQMASGAPAGDGTGLITYNDIDGNLVEELEVAKPLINVFIYGPVVDMGYGIKNHSFMDTYAAVSLDDGLTWKQTNLSESADLSSFNLDTDHVSGGNTGGQLDPGGGGGGGNHDDDSEDRASGKGGNSGGQATAGDGTGSRASGKGGNTGGQAANGGAQNSSGVTNRAAIDPKGDQDGDGCGVQDGTGAGIPLEDGSGEGCEGGINLAGTGSSKGARIPGQGGGNGFGGLGNGAGLGGGPGSDNGNGDGTGNGGGQFGGPASDDDSSDDNSDDEDSDDHEEVVDLTDYPGGVTNVFRAIAGNKMLVAWPSHFCQQGQPAYQMSTDTQPDLERLAAVTDFIRNGDDLLGVPALSDFTSPIDGDLELDDLYLTDAFGVAGSQGSQDFADEGYPLAGVVPYQCLWTARGVILPGDDPRTADSVEESHMVWTKAERLTSGRRSVNRIEVSAVQGAGFAVTWQEDPEGLRPGQGLGPGEGWSGAVAHPQTDAWYSFINEEYFDIVETVDNTTVPIDILDHDLLLSGRPQVFVPMAVPMRLTNNAKCNPADDTDAIVDDLYCDFELAGIFGITDQCAATVEVPVGPNDELQPICVVDSDGDTVADLPNRANTATTRPRLSTQGYESDLAITEKSAWVIVVAEESKGLGRFFFEPSTDGTYAIPCEEGSSLTCTEEIGKNIWYHTFDMGTPDTSAGIGEPNSLVSNVVNQGNMLNAPEVYWETGELYGLMATADMWNYDPYNFDIVGTEIARRGSLLVQGIAKAVASESHLMATPAWKQGPMRQGGPADVMLRRVVLPEGYGGGEEPPEDCVTVDPDGPYINVANIRGNGSRIQGNGAGLDGDRDTGAEIRDAVSSDTLLEANELPQGRFNFNGAITAEPCALQAADAGAGNWGPIYLLSESCEVPPVCSDDGSSVVADGESDLPGIEVNPYSVEYMVCGEYLIEPDVNPYYPGGVCLDPAINLSGVVADTCMDDDTGGEVECPAIDCDAGSDYCIGDTNPILQGVVQGEGNTQRLLTWHQCPSEGTVIASDGVTPVACETDETNLDDESWYNPLDIAKGHRGFIDGDFVMFLYAWSPNWRLNAKGSDRYELYVRRSFDGGETWTTLPSSFMASTGDSYSGDGTVTCESYRSSETGTGTVVEPKACYDFGAGAAEHARNITQHKSMNITTLDPRYAITGSPRGVSITDTCTDGLFVDPLVIDGIFTCDDTSEVMDTDLRNPSRYFMVFETGDNNTVAEGEAEPLDLNYSRAESFGDDYVVWTETDTDSADATLCYPSDPHDVEDVSDVIVGSGFCNEFDRLNTSGDTHSSEASLAGNSDGSKMYGVWAQWVFEDDNDYESEIIESDAMARRVWWIDDYISTDNSYTLPGTSQP